MRITVIGGTGLIGSKVVQKLRTQGHEVLVASPDSGVDTVSGKGLAEVLEGASVVVDASNSPSFDEAAAMTFFDASTRNLLAAEQAAGVKHHVALSVVGTERLSESGYFRAKIAQEKLIKASPVPYTIVHATQFFEFLKKIVAAATIGDTVRLAPVLIQPMAADDVASAVVSAALAAPVNGVVEVAGPEQVHLDALVQQALRASNDPRKVLADSEALYFGAHLSERTLVPDPGAKLGSIRLTDWLAQQAP